MHYCYVYLYQGQQVEAPTLRLNPGDQLVLNLTDNIQAPYDKIPEKSQMNMHVPPKPAQSQPMIATVAWSCPARPTCISTD